jgi:hypothetical protein
MRPLVSGLVGLCVLPLGLTSARAEPPVTAPAFEKNPGAYVSAGALQLAGREGANALFRGAQVTELPRFVPRFGLGLDGAFASGLDLGVDVRVDYWSSGDAALLGVTMAPRVGLVFLATRRWTFTGSGGLGLGVTRLALHDGPLFQPAPGRALNIEPESRPQNQSQTEFAKVAADPARASMFQRLSLAGVAQLSAEHGDRGGGPLAGVTLGFQAPLVQGEWSLHFDRDVGASPNTPLAGLYLLFSVGYRFSPASESDADAMATQPAHAP